MFARWCLLALIALLALGFPPAAFGSSTPIPGRFIVVLKAGQSGHAVAAAHRRLLGAQLTQTYDAAIHGYAARLSDRARARIAADPRVDRIVQDREGQAITAQTLPTGVDRVDADLGSQLAGNGAGTTPGDIATFDTGIQPNHPDLNVAGGVDCLKGYSGDDGTWYDANGHGTHVAGILGAKDDLNGVVGVAPGVRLWAVRTLSGTGSGSTATQLCGINWLTANGPSLGIKVVNASQVLLGTADDGNCGNTSGDVLHQAICRSTAAGLLWVFGAGNNPIDYKNGAGPSYDEVLTVTGAADSNGQPNVGSTATFNCVEVTSTKKNPTSTTQTDDKYASFSAFAVSPADQAHTIAAPASCIYSTWKGSTYGRASGTSMATPHVAGAAHLCILSGQCVGTPAEIMQKLRSDAAAYAQANPLSGFAGDPLRPVSGRYYGYLIQAGLY
jgi:subtilisin